MKKRHTSRREKRSVSGNKRIPVFLLSLVVLVLAGMGYFIYDLNFRKHTSQEATPAAQPITDTPATQAASAVQLAAKTDSTTGLIVGEGLQAVKANCISCHSSKLILQNRFTRDGWLAKIRWMQQKQGLWDLGSNEPIILDYLSTHYAPGEILSRRPPLEDIQWYRLEE